MRAIHATGSSFLNDPALQTSVIHIGLIARYTRDTEKAKELFSRALATAGDDHKGSVVCGIGNGIRGFAVA
jgi:hypothetical protein